jgi:hypothetical protein
MKPQPPSATPAARLRPLLACAGMFAGMGMLALAHAQAPVLGNVKNFELSEYFEPPRETQMKWELTSAVAQSRTNGAYLLKDMRLEMFREDGRTEIVVLAPECLYDPATKFASSTGAVELRSGDGQLVTRGKGFMWNQADSSLRISNRVETVVQPPAKPLATNS